MRQRPFERAIVLSAAILVSAALLFPVYWIFATAVLPTSLTLSSTPTVVPPRAQINLGAFAAVFQRTPLVSWLMNSSIVTMASAVMSAVPATLAGYSLSRFRVRGGAGIAYVLFVGRILPGTLVALPFFVMFRVVGLLDSLVAVVLANAGAIVPFATWLMKSYFDSIPEDLDDAALVDGCSRARALWHVLLPVSRPAIGATLIFAATASWAELLFARTLLLSQKNWTVPVGIASLIGEVSTNWNQLMAAGAISILPVLLVYWLVQPHLVSGITAGAVKG
jgi:multiple sugar transport system permease protein